jgi:hypothetical protein
MNNAIRQAATVPPENVSKFSEIPTRPPAPAVPAAARSRSARDARSPESKGEGAPPPRPAGTDNARPSAPVTAPRAAAPAVETSIRPIADRPDGPMYEAGSAGVTPPALLTPNVEPLPPPGRRNAAVPAVQIIVDADGTVEMASATFMPTTIGDNLLMTNALSVAKTWRFTPAEKDGRPVKYRLFVPLSAF